ncbi:hypothetical protein QTL86_06840 [Cellulosilyticum sp. ST5]|uniref:hypothetical protein n=1 Tax=Cellulosilyticum sp. ST5 TaxID=3055805 RepID=UPI0039774CDA
MADVTFGVKVPEELKNELSELMKDSTLSGKEFMGMLLASYKLEKAKEENSLFEGDLKELQTLLKRVQGIYTHMIEKSQLGYQEQLKEIEKKMEEQVAEKEEILLEHKKTKEILEDAEKKEFSQLQEIEALKSKLSDEVKEKEQVQQQLNNHLLLHTKFEEEITLLKEQVTGYKRLELEIEERNNENGKLKNRNDELASEIWFLQREVEKLKEEKNQLETKQQQELTQLKDKQELQLRNELLEQKLSFKEEISHLKEQITKEKEAYHQLERDYTQKLQDMYKQK